MFKRIVLLVLSFVWLQMRLWQGAASIPDYWRLQKAILLQQTQVTELNLRNQRLDAEVTELKKTPHALEERARSELGFIKSFETFCQIIDTTTD